MQDLPVATEPFGLQPRRELTHTHRYDVVLLGAGYAGLMASLRLGRRSSRLRVALVSEGETFVERVRLQESVARPVEQRLPPLSNWLSTTNVNFICGPVVELLASIRTVMIETGGGLVALEFSHCVFALGSKIDVSEALGAKEHAFRLDPGSEPKSAAALRHRLDLAPREQRAIVVGGGNSAVETAAEIKLRRPDFEVTMIAARTAGDFGKGSQLTSAVRRELVRQRIALIDGTPVGEVTPDCVVAESGQRFAADVVVWAGGLRSPDLAAAAGVAVDEKNRILVDSRLRSVSHPYILAVGDAARPIAPTGAMYRMSAFAALTSGAYAAESLLKEASGKPSRPFSFSSFGQGVAIGKSGVGFITFPDDGDAYFIFTGRLALRIRNLFVRMLVWFLRIDRRLPTFSLFWIGRDRVSTDEARQAEAAQRVRNPRQPMRRSSAKTDESAER